MRALVMAAGFPLYERTLAGRNVTAHGGNIAGVTFALEVGLSEGTPLDFAVAPGGTVAYDQPDLSVAIGEVERPSLLPVGHITLRPATEFVWPTAAGQRYVIQHQVRLPVTDPPGQEPFLPAPVPGWHPPANAVPDGAWMRGTGFEAREFFPVDQPTGFYRFLRSMSGPGCRRRARGSRWGPRGREVRVDNVG